MRRYILLVSLLAVFVCVKAQNNSLDIFYQRQIELKISNGYSLINSNEEQAGIEYLIEAIALAISRSQDKQAALIVLNSNSFTTVVEYYYKTDNIQQAREYLDKHIRLCTRVKAISADTDDQFDYIDASYSIISGLASNNKDYLSSIKYTLLHKNYIFEKEAYSDQYFQKSTFLIYDYIESNQYIEALNEAILSFRDKINIGIDLDEALQVPSNTVLSIKTRAAYSNKLSDIISINQIWTDFLNLLSESYSDTLIDSILLTYDGKQSIEESIIYEQTSITRLATLMSSCTCELKLNGYDAAHAKLKDLYDNLNDNERQQIWPVICFSYLATLEDLKQYSSTYRFCKTFENTINDCSDFSEYYTYFYIYYFGACERFGDIEKLFEILNNTFDKVPSESSLYWMVSRLKGSMYIKLGLNENALESMTSALNSYKLPDTPTSSDMILYAGLISYVGDAHRRCGNFEESVSEFEKAIKICDQYNIPNSKLHPYFNLGRLFYDRGEYAKSKEYFLKCSQIHKDSDATYNTSSPYSYLFDIDRRLGNITEAQEHLRATWREKIEEYYTMRDFLTIHEQTQYWRFSGYIDFIGGLIAESAPTYNDIYFDMLLTSKGFLLSSEREEYLNVVSSKDSRLIDLYNETHALNYSNQNRIDEYMALYRSHGFTPQIGQVSWSDVRNALKKNAIAVELFQYSEYNSDKSDLIEYYGALVIKHNSNIPVFTKLCKAADINNLIAKGSKIYSVDGLLYDLLWTPLSAHMKGMKDIYISPQGELHKVNFSAIKDPKGNPLYKIHNIHRVSSTGNITKDYKTSVTSSHLYGGLIYEANDSTMLAEHRKYPSSMNNKLWIKDDTRSGWAYLPNTQIEVDSIEDILKLKDINIVKYHGSAGTEESFKNLSGKKPGIIHLATHGFYLQNSKGANPYYPETALIRSGLILSNGGRAWSGEPIPLEVEDGILQADEISKINLDGTSLLVMSACETALGETSGDGIYGLQRAFKISGVETIVMSLWEIDDKATSIFMIHFYNYLMEYNDKYIAFTKAQAKLMKDYPDPYYWAAFIMLD